MALDDDLDCEPDDMDKCLSKACLEELDVQLQSEDGREVCKAIKQLLAIVNCAEREAALAKQLALEATERAERAEATAVRARRLYSRLVCPRKTKAAAESRRKKSSSLFRRRFSSPRQAGGDEQSSAEGFGVLLAAAHTSLS